MSLEQIAAILRDSPLDVETKLFAIDLIALSDDKRLVQDVMELILEWKKSDVETTNTLHDALFALSETYQDQLASLSKTQARSSLQIADQVNSEEKIQKIRQQLIQSSVPPS